MRARRRLTDLIWSEVFSNGKWENFINLAGTLLAMDGRDHATYYRRALANSEMAKTKAGGKSEIIDTLIAYEWKSLFGPFTKDPAELAPRKA